MIYDVAGDILLSRAQTIAHGVAPGDDFHSGLALALREQWPSMARDFKHFCHTRTVKPGEAWMWGGTGGARIVCLVTQEPAPHAGQHPGRAHLEYVNHALRELHKMADKEGFTSIALPRLATGVGGLDWDKVKPLIQHHLGALNIPIFIYGTYHKGMRAEEPGLAAATA